jgi:hypothetical protein
MVPIANFVIAGCYKVIHDIVVSQLRTLCGIGEQFLFFIASVLGDDSLCPFQHDGQFLARFATFAVDVTNDLAKLDTKLLLVTLGTFSLAGVTVTPLHYES